MTADAGPTSPRLRRCAALGLALELAALALYAVVGVQGLAQADVNAFALLGLLIFLPVAVGAGVGLCLTAAGWLLRRRRPQLATQLCVTGLVVVVAVVVAEALFVVPALLQ